MKILVTGAHGLLGRSILRPHATTASHGVEFVGSGRRSSGVWEGVEYHRVDLSDAVAMRRLLDTIEPRWVIHTVAMTDVDGCESDRAGARQANLQTVETLVDACRQVGGTDSCGLVQLSTDYVFDGQDGPYYEDAEPRPLSHYGELKLHSERLVLDADIRGAVVRTLWLYGYRRGARPNLVTWPLTALGHGETLRIVDDQWGNPTFVDDVVSALIAICRRDATGIFHAAGTDLMTRHELVLQLADRFSLDRRSIEAVSTRQLSQKATRPLRSGLQSMRLGALGETPRGLREGLDRMVSEDEFRLDFQPVLTSQ